MNVSILDIKGTWRSVADAARTTIGLEAGDKEISSYWKRRMLLCEHSPIRKLLIEWKWTDLMSWVSVHFVRHKYGIEHWVRSQRPDRYNADNRDAFPQGNFINHECEANAQAIINISRKRLCHQASHETRLAWIKFLMELNKHEPELYDVCVPDCIYRGWCYEWETCGFYRSSDFNYQLNEYRDNINGYGEEIEPGLNVIRYKKEEE